MSEPTVDWASLRPRPAGPSKSTGLRERKKWMLRQQLTDVATRMFLDRGFDGVRVAEVADRCNVSEKTVFNYFPTKEALILDRWDSTTAGIQAALAEPDLTPVQACVRVLDEETRGLTVAFEAYENPAAAVADIRRFGELLNSTPSLRAHQRATTERLIDEAQRLLAKRAGADEDAPEPRIAAVALLGLWDVHARSMRKHLTPGRTPADVHAAIMDDVRRAARVIETGIEDAHLAAPPT
ncbi:TetR family transcriptional regulator [Actinoallomurus rhizosphaericola]|uniref:TetR family transcriptional regulator n=1 Tax=Actinoallomurus rhizosphaericola TaxID=2952536 RepID=UPI0020924919|nr:TetR family transcriptional regulator [Actinoallomurus rhizosphaericola]MCO5995685.1 TetR/AcrR family transcriptional regulator [Actinoallomurus rhizosphaericola]